MENQIGERISQLIDASKKSTSAFARSIGKPNTTITNIVSGRNKPGFEIIEAIIEKHGVNPTWLIRGEGAMFAGETAAVNLPAPDQYLRDQIQRLEDNFNRLANQLEVKDRQIEHKDQQIEGLQQAVNVLLGKSDLSEYTPWYVLNSLEKKRA